MKISREEALEYHSSEPKGKVEVVATKPCLTSRDLSLAYTPGVAEPCREIHDDVSAVADDLAVRLPAEGSLAHHVKRQPALRDRSHRMMDSAAPEPALREDAGAVLGAEKMIAGHDHVGVLDVVVQSRLGHDLYTRRVARHDEHAVRAHHEEDVRHTTCAGEPLLPIDDPFVADA